MKFQTQLFFFFTYRSDLSGNLYFFENVCRGNFSIFFVYFLRMCEKICTFAADFENDITIVN